MKTLLFIIVIIIGSFGFVPDNPDMVALKAFSEQTPSAWVIERETLGGTWSPVIVVFGYGDDWLAAVRIVSSLPKRDTYRIVPVETYQLATH